MIMTSIHSIIETELALFLLELQKSTTQLEKFINPITSSLAGVVNTSAFITL